MTSPVSEAWFRRRTSIEDRFREGKHGTGLHHLPSGQASINTIWACGALLTGALTTMVQPLIGQRPDHAARTRTQRCATGSSRCPDGSCGTPADSPCA